jgi:hypothetical protein
MVLPVTSTLSLLSKIVNYGCKFYLTLGLDAACKNDPILLVVVNYSCKKFYNIASLKPM